MAPLLVFGLGVPVPLQVARPSFVLALAVLAVLGVVQRPCAMCTTAN